MHVDDDTSLRVVVNLTCSPHVLDLQHNVDSLLFGNLG